MTFIFSLFFFLLFHLFLFDRAIVEQSHRDPCCSHTRAGSSAAGNHQSYPGLTNLKLDVGLRLKHWPRPHIEDSGLVRIHVW